MTPYFRKSSALSEVGWGSYDSRDGSLNKCDKRTIPLKLCYLCRNLTVPDPQNRTIELHSPDAKSSCVLRCPDDHIASQWFNALHSQVHTLTQHAISEANQALGTPNNTLSGDIKHMAWLSEQVCAQGVLITIMIFFYDWYEWFGAKET